MNEIKELKAQIRRLKNESRALRDKLYKVEADRQKFRDHFAKNYKWFVELLASNQTPNLSYLVRQQAKVFQETDIFWWDWSSK